MCSVYPLKERDREGDVPQLQSNTVQRSDLFHADFLRQDNDAAVTFHCSHQCQPDSWVVGRKGNWLTTTFAKADLCTLLPTLLFPIVSITYKCSQTTYR